MIVREVTIGNCRLIHADNRAVVPGLTGFDCIVCDPPYGIGITRSNRLSTSRGFTADDWDDARPDIAWMLAAGVPVIVWGGNYFDLPPTRAPLVWDKNNAGLDFADFEMAWSNLDMVARRIVLRPMNMDGGKLHPTQKPVRVMEWCLSFIPDASVVLDPFMGSASTGVAAVNLGLSFIGIEANARHFETAVRRITDAHRQADLFISKPAPVAPVQGDLL